MRRDRGRRASEREKKPRAFFFIYRLFLNTFHLYRKSRPLFTVTVSVYGRSYVFVLKLDIILDHGAKDEAPGIILSLVTVDERKLRGKGGRIVGGSEYLYVWYKKPRSTDEV